jgi:sortase A
LLLEEGAIANRNQRSRHLRHVHHWPHGAIWFGVAIVLWSIFFVRAPIPQQDPPVIRPAVVVKETPSLEYSTSEAVVVEDPPLYTRRPDIGEKIGTITLESLDLSWPIFEGTDEAQLSRGVGHYTKSVLPGMDDNTILAGHRNTVFNRLGELKVGDLILVKTEAGIFTYQAKSFKVVSRADRTVIMPSETGTLTLSTCYPFNNIGTTTDAYIVTAELIESAR